MRGNSAADLRVENLENQALSGEGNWTGVENLETRALSREVTQLET